MREGYIDQVPQAPNELLTKLDGKGEETRLFAKSISYKEGKGHPWEECTQAFYDEWQATYRPEEPEDIEPDDAEE